MLNLIHSFLVNCKQWVATKEAKSLVKTSSTGSPQGCVWSPILFSIYVQDMPVPSMGNYHLIKYADDTILLELCYPNVPSTLPAAAECLTSWFSSQDLLLNVSKTKELIFTNMRDNRACDPLVINGTVVEQVESFVYLGTTVDHKLSFKAHSEAVIKKARKRLFIMKKLSSLGISKPIRMRCYYTFIECVFIYHLCTLFGHISKTCRNSINDVISTASFLADCEVPSLCEVFTRVFKNRCLRMYATDNEPILALATLPSGRYCNIKCRIELRRQCFRAQCVKFLNSVFFKR